MKRLTLFVLLSAVTCGATPLPGSEAVAATGGFIVLPSPPALSGGAVAGPVIGEWPGHLVSGRAATGVFNSPDYLEFELAGYPKLPGMRIYLEDAADAGQTLGLAVARNSPVVWMTRRWSLPREWRNRHVRLVVRDTEAPGPDRWIGVSLPRAYRPWNLSRFLYPVRMVVYLGMESLLLLLPGLAFAIWFSRRGVGSPQRTVMLMMATCGIIATAAFFLFVFSVPLGRVFSVIAPLVSAVVLFRYHGRIVPVLRGTVAAVLAVWLLASVFYLSAGLLYRNEDGVGEHIQDRFFEYQMPPDNLLPFILGDAIFHRAPFRPAFFGDIQSSDRPPLQTGFILMQLNFWSFPPMQYLILGVLLQTSWIPALWVLLRAQGISGPPLFAAITVTAFSQFAFVHELFVWPKLLSATFGLLALACFGWFTGRENDRFDAVLGGIFTALAMLSHGGVMMTVFGFAALTAIWHRPRWRWFVTFTLSAAALYLPWILYQRIFDPPGDALLKLHLAGIIDRHHSLGWLIVAGYSKLGWAGALMTKWINFKYLFWPAGGSKLFSSEGRWLYRFSELNFFHLFPALGFANAGFLFLFFRGRRHRKQVMNILAVCAASLAVWLILMIQPNSTSVHQGSFVTVILLFTALTLLVDSYSRWAAAALLVVQAVEFIVVAIAAKPDIGNTAGHISDTVADPGMFLVFFLSLLMLGGVLWIAWRRESVLYTKVN